MNQAQFRLLSGSSSLDCLDVGDFETVRDTLQLRLLKALCMTEAPADDDDNILLWNQLLADALAVSVNVKQDDGVKSESMRNYSYTLQDWANSWMALALKAGDLIDIFNVCPSGVTFQRNIAGHIYGHRYYCGSCEGHCECL